MSKVVLFSTRHIHIDEENYLFGKNCQSLVSKNGENFHLLVNYFTKCDSGNNLFLKYYKKTDPNAEIIKYLKEKRLWKPEYEKKSLNEVLKEIRKDLPDPSELDNKVKARKNSTKVSEEFDYGMFWEDVLSNKSHLKELNIDKDKDPVTLQDRFSIYILGDPNDALTKDYVFMAIWPLAQTRKFNENGENLWISTLVEQICKIVENCEEITLLLHEKDICESQPFRIIIPQKEYTVDSNRKVNLSVAIFQHTPGDPINAILKKPQTDLSEAYNNIFTVLTKAEDMRKAGNEHTTRQVYQNLVNAPDNKKQAE